MNKPRIDILCVGELLVDFITAEYVETLEDGDLFKRIPGGSPANLCMNMARLGHSAMLSATVGNDDMGSLLIQYVKSLGVDCKYILAIPEQPTTLILVTRSKQVSDFQVYRGADAYLSPKQFPLGNMSAVRIFHTTCFALSLNPAREVILDLAEKMKRAGAQLSIDVNYAQKIWPEQKVAQRIVSEYCRLGAFVKVSDVDWERLYGDKPEPDTVIDHFLRLQAKQVCLTLGSKGCWVANDSERHFIPAREVEVVDTTGAGDAFWSGYLSAWLEEKDIKTCALFGRKMAEMKLQHFGPLPAKVDREILVSDVESLL
jgi:sugar/nucleoside kinase (ribokinase family)